ncbi:MAG: glycoside hydrolase [Candidatus Marsarchaeota archaeon]|nr:glycoside hydrolase [Candidatus Marsarchaeota archaeon]
MSQSSDHGATWSSPVQLAEGYYGHPSIVAVDDQTILVVWSGSAAIRGRYSRWSHDGGRTWSAVVVVAPGLAGLSSPSRMVVDSAGDVHMAINSDGPEAIMYTRWMPDGWGSLQNVSQTNYDEGKHVVAVPDVGISQGNQIHIVYVDEGLREVEAAGAGQSRSIEGAPTRPASVSVADSVKAAPNVPASGDSDLHVQDGKWLEFPSLETSSILLVSILPASILLLLVVGAGVWWRSR